MTTQLWTMTAYFGMTLLVVAGMLGLSWVLGQRHREPATDSPYESGVTPEGSARLRVFPGFFLVATFFLVFDLEVVFIFLWAVAGRELGWAGYWEVLVFVAILLLALAYLWSSRALDWAPPPRTGRHRR